MLDHIAIQQAATMMFWTDARAVFGEAGSSGLSRLLNSIREVFRMIPPDQMSTAFVFVYPLCGLGVAESGGATEHVASGVSAEDLPGYRRRIEDAPAILILVRDDGRYDLIVPLNVPSVEDLSERSLVFLNENGIDQFIIGRRMRMMPRFVIGAASNFAVATVGDLDEAFERYRRDASEVSCPILAEVWVGGRDGHRLVFKNRPEAAMRRSLERFLSNRMKGDVSVRAEHNTDESRPVDLVVNWFGSKMRALIEIKWMGKSLTRGSDGTQFTTYGDRRAQEGAAQLVDYIDRERSTDASSSLKGYLVVFDGRRRNIRSPTTPVTLEDALYYRDRNVVLSHDYSNERSNISRVVRYFLEPRSSFFVRAKSVG